MHFIRRYRVAALFCALSVLLCELIARPYASMGICDDGPYILVAQKLANTGHIVYNGWSAAMLVWQLYLGAAFIKLFGFSFTAVRMSTLLVAVMLAFVLQRTLVRSGVTERNATIGTLALVLSPLYLELSVTFMSDIHGLFAIVLCLYACLRALQSATDRAAILWLCFAVATDALIGTSRQLAWLGVLVMVPSTLWLLRSRRRVLLAGAAASLVGVLFIFACMHWLRLQPYTLPEHFGIGRFPIVSTIHVFILFLLDLPFLLLPIMLLFIFGIRRLKPRMIFVVCGIALGYFFLATYPSHLRGSFTHLREPTLGDWLSVVGGYSSVPKGRPPIFLQPSMQILMTMATYSSLLVLFALLARSCRTGTSVVKGPPPRLPWHQLMVLLLPFTLAYNLLLFYRAATIVGSGTPQLIDRYALGLLVVALLVLVRYYQDRIDPRLPGAALLFIGIMAVSGVAVTHNTFALYRARVAIAAELRAAGVPDTSVDGGWEYNMLVELEHSDHINDPLIVVPAHAYVLVPPPPDGDCPTFWYARTPHIHARYGISFDPNLCDGPAPFAPVHYSRWLASRPGTLYVVRYTHGSAILE